MPRTTLRGFEASWGPCSWLLREIGWLARTGRKPSRECTVYTIIHSLAVLRLTYVWQEKDFNPFSLFWNGPKMPKLTQKLPLWKINSLRKLFLIDLQLSPILLLFIISPQFTTSVIACPSVKSWGWPACTIILQNDVSCRLTAQWQLRRCRMWAQNALGP